MDYEFTEHAQDAMRKRNIEKAWVERALQSPHWTEKDNVDPSLEHRLAHIPEFGGRVLRVVLNPETTPARVVTLFFDHRRR